MNLLEFLRALGRLRLCAALVLLVGVAVLAIGLAAHGTEPAEEGPAGARAAKAAADLDDSARALRALAAVGAALPSPDARSLAPAGELLLRQRPALSALGWMTRPPAARKDGVMTVALLAQQGQDGGGALAALAQGGDALDRARDTGDLLLRRGATSGTLVLAAPLYQRAATTVAERRKALRGYLVAVVRGDALRGADAPGLALSLTDAAAPRDPPLIALGALGPRPAQAHLSVADRELTLRLSLPGPPPPTPLRAPLALGTGLTLAALLIGLLLDLARARRGVAMALDQLARRLVLPVPPRAATPADAPAPAAPAPAAPAPAKPPATAPAPPPSLLLLSTEIEPSAVASRAAALEAKLAEAARESRARGELLCGMSDDLRSPLLALLGYADLLAQDPETAENPERRREVARALRQRGEELGARMEMLLSLAEIEAGQIAPLLDAVPLAALIGMLTSQLRPRAEARGLFLSVEIAPDLPPTVRSDEGLLREALLALLQYCIDATRTGGVRLRLRRSERAQLAFDVFDGGAGHGREPVAQLLDGRGPPPRSMGAQVLGPLLARELARLLGGDLVLLHSKPGVGNRYLLTVDPGPLPAPQLGAQPIALLEADTSGPALTPRPLDCSVLVVEESRELQQLVQRMLRRAGARCTIVESAEHALAAVAGGPFDAVLAEAAPAGALAERLRERGYRGAIVALVGEAQAGEEEALLRAGCDDVLRKPLNQKSIVEKLSPRQPRGA